MLTGSIESSDITILLIIREKKKSGMLKTEHDYEEEKTPYKSATLQYILVCQATIRLKCDTANT